MRVSKVDDVLRGARTVFLKFGFEGASVDAIAEEAKVSKATLYAHCSSKEQLFLIVVQAECDRLSAEISRPLSSREDPRSVLEELSRRMIDLVMDDDYIRLLRSCIGAVSVLPEAGDIYMEAGPKRATGIVSARAGLPYCCRSVHSSLPVRRHHAETVGARASDRCIRTFHESYRHLSRRLFRGQ